VLLSRVNRYHVWNLCGVFRFLRKFMSKSPHVPSGNRLATFSRSYSSSVQRGKAGIVADGILPLKCDGTHAETKFLLSPKRTSPLKSAGASIQSTAGSPVLPISASNAGYTTFRGSVRVLATHCISQFPLHFPSRASPCAIRFQTHSTFVSASCRHKRRVRIVLWLTVRLCLQLCAKFLYCTMADGTFVPAAVCQVPLFSVSLPSELIHRGGLGTSSAAVLSKWQFIKQNEVLQEILAELPNVSYICAT